MGLRYQKRVNLGKGVGVNVSKSGVSPSIRTKYGSIGPNGFSIRTGIPGLSYRSEKNSKASAVMFVIGVLTALIYFLIWLGQKTYRFVMRKKDVIHSEASQNEQI